jgi:hypothetical protein
MAEVTLIVAPIALAKIVGVHAVKISTRKLYACNEKLETLFKCSRKPADSEEITKNFLQLVALIAERATLENLPKKSLRKKSKKRLTSNRKSVKFKYRQRSRNRKEKRNGNQNRTNPGMR